MPEAREPQAPMQAREEDPPATPPRPELLPTVPDAPACPTRPTHPPSPSISSESSHDPFDDRMRAESPDPLDLLPRAFVASLDAVTTPEHVFELPTSDPLNYTQAMKTAASHEWETATALEISKLEKLGCWDLVDAQSVPPGHKSIGSKFVYKSKLDKNGALASRKSTPGRTGKPPKSGA